MKNSTKTYLFQEVHRRIRMLDYTYSEVAHELEMSPSAFSHRMNGKTPWTEPEMQRLLDILGQPEDTLADLFLRRQIW